MSYITYMPLSILYSRPPFFSIPALAKAVRLEHSNASSDLPPSPPLPSSICHFCCRALKQADYDNDARQGCTTTAVFFVFFLSPAVLKTRFAEFVVASGL